ncbi:MAG: hypothetical protein QNK37_29640, partial [Acidobacteriota bacterium]|nr:hypothetical protein [Acidobacteriota bacterium]
MKLGKLLRAFNVKRGEGQSVAWLLLFSVFLGMFIACWLTVSNAAFLESWGSGALPYAYVVAGLLGLVIMRFFARWEKRLPFKSLLTYSLLGNLVMVFFFCIASLLGVSKALAFVLLIFTGPVLGMVGLAFWGIAGRMFDLQQGKRLFGLISSGEVASNIVAFFVIARLPKDYQDPPDLLALAAIGLAGTLVTALLIVKRFNLKETESEDQDILGDEGPVAEEAASPKPMQEPRNYLLLVSTAAFLAVFVQYCLDFALLTEVNRKISVGGTAAFLAVFFGFLSFAELLVKFLLSGRLLKQFGMLMGLGCVPAVLLLFMVFALPGAGGSEAEMVSGGVADSVGAVGGALARASGETFTPSLFFSIILAAKIAEHVLRFAIFETSFKILFQPLPKQMQFTAQTRVEGLVRQGGISATGLFLVVLDLFYKEGLVATVCA